MPPKPSNFDLILQAEIPPDTGSPDPLDTIDDDIEADSGSDPSPPPRALTGGRIIRQPLPAHRGQSDEEWSSPIRHGEVVGRSLERSPVNEEEDSPGAIPAHLMFAAEAVLERKLDFGALSSDSDTEAAPPFAMTHSASIPMIPRTPSPNVGGYFGELRERLPSGPPQSEPVSSRQESVEDDDRPLIPPAPVPPPELVWFSADESRVGAVLVPVRDDPKFPPELQDAEMTMASQIASATSDPNDEGLGSATFQTLLNVFLLPRLKGHNLKGQKVQIHQYPQFAARRRQPQGTAASGRFNKDADALARRYKLEKDDAESLWRLDAIAQRRVPDTTCMVSFEEKIPLPNGLSYHLESHRGPKLSITEIKSFAWTGDHALLHAALSGAAIAAHQQNYVAAQFAFAEDERLNQLASFIGVGPIWVYAEWCRRHYPDVHGIPSPRNNAEFKRIGYPEREASITPDRLKTAVRSRKRLRMDSPESEHEPPQQPDVDDPEPAAPPPTRGGPNTRAVLRDPQVHLPKIGSRPWSLPDHIQEIFTRRKPVERPRAENLNSISKSAEYLYILDPDGRTYEAFDAIVERIREWYSGDECPEEYRIIFDEDPYAGGSCPATVAKTKGKARA